MTHHGWLALDIDGTLTDSPHMIPNKVVSYLRSKANAGWKILVLTGRSYVFAKTTIEKMDFPFILSTQNGSAAWHMPNEKLIFERYFSKEALLEVEKIALGYDLALITYGSDYNSYYRAFKKYDDYADSLSRVTSQESIKVVDFSSLSDEISFPLIKLSGPIDEIERLNNFLVKLDLYSTAVIKDPFHEGVYFLLITKKGVSKGSGIMEILNIYGKKIVIAAGNDMNDSSMFDVADISIAMKNSPEKLIKKADIIAPPCEELGIISALDEAIEKAFLKI